MTVTINANVIHIGLSKGLLKAQGWDGAYKKAYAGVREMKLGKRVWKRLKNTKIDHQFNQISLMSTIIIRNL